MSYINMFENFNDDNSKIWIVGVPSGEALQVDRDIFDDIYATGVLKYNITYVATGFFTFEDKDIERIKRMIAWSKEYFSANDNKKIDIEPNDFKNIEELISATNNIKSKISIEARGNFLRFSSDSHKIDLIITDYGNYELKVYRRDASSGRFLIINDYMIPIRTQAKGRIEAEAKKYFDEDYKSSNLSKDPKSYMNPPIFKKEEDNIPYAEFVDLKNTNKGIAMRLARHKNGGRLVIIEKIVGIKVILFNGFEHYDDPTQFDIYPEITEFDEVYVYDKKQEFPGGVYTNTSRDWKLYRIKSLPADIKKMIKK